MEIKRISRGEMPPANKYILIYLPGKPWGDRDDEQGKLWRVAKCVYGISQAKRMELSNLGLRRAKIIEECDEFGNNLKPYCFKEFGPGRHFGQEVDIWCELPKVEAKEG